MGTPTQLSAGKAAVPARPPTALTNPLRETGLGRVMGYSVRVIESIPTSIVDGSTGRESDPENLHGCGVLGGQAGSSGGEKATSTANCLTSYCY